MKISGSILFAVLISGLFIQLSCGRQKLETETKDSSKIDSPKISFKKNPYSDLDQSPMDMVYFPIEYPITKMNSENIGDPIARLIYSRPHTKGRVIFGNSDKSLCPYGKPWRLGANEATEIEFFVPVHISGKNLEPNKYVIYCIPEVSNWTIVFNRNINTWGLHIDSTKDFVRIKIPSELQEPRVEDFTMQFEASQNGANLIMAWDNVKATLPMVFMKRK